MSGDDKLFKTINGLLKILFEREEVHLSNQEKAMIIRNTEAGGSPDGFRHLGVIYSPLEGYARPRGTYNMLPISLIPDIDQLVADRALLALDKDRIRQALTLVLRDCKSIQDHRDALPNCMKDFILGANSLERTRPEAFTLEGNPRSYAQYVKLREKIEFYTAARLLY
jgi:hypothetical protein